MAQSAACLLGSEREHRAGSTIMRHAGDVVVRLL